MSKLIVVDVESDGPIIGLHSMVCFGAVLVDKEGKLDKTFYGQTKPISTTYNQQALDISGFTRKEHEKFDDPTIVMTDFAKWLRSIGTVTLISDNNGYDASWINYYLHLYTGSNPFGWSSRRIGDLFCGYHKDMYYKWKKHRDNKKYPHNHDPLSDAKGNASALLWFNENCFKIL